MARQQVHRAIAARHLLLQTFPKRTLRWRLGSDIMLKKLFHLPLSPQPLHNYHRANHSLLTHIQIRVIALNVLHHLQLHRLYNFFLFSQLFVLSRTVSFTLNTNLKVLLLFLYRNFLLLITHLCYLLFVDSVVHHGQKLVLELDSCFLLLVGFLALFLFEYRFFFNRCVFLSDSI